MNEYFKQTAEQAGFCLWEDEPWNPGEVVDWSSRYDPELEKFGELIIQDIIKIATEVQSESVSNACVNYNAGREMGIEVLVNQLKKFLEK